MIHHFGRTGLLSDKPSASIPKCMCGIDFRLALPGLPDHSCIGKFTRFYCCAPFQVIIHRDIDASICFCGKENGFVCICPDKTPIPARLITGYPVLNGLIILKYPGVFYSQGAENGLLKVTGIGLTTEFFNQHTQQTIGRIAITVTCTRTKIKRICVLNSRKYVFVGCMFHFECVCESIVVWYSGGMIEQLTDADGSERPPAV